MRRAIVLLFILFAVTAGWARQSSTSPDSPSENDQFKKECGGFHVPGCAEVLFTGSPLHTSVGSIAPQNGVAGGVAYVDGKNTDNWRISWNADSVASGNGSWRAGAYFQFVQSNRKNIAVGVNTTKRKISKSKLTALPEHAVFTLQAQTITLNKLMYFGLGPNTSDANRSFYGMRQTIIGGTAFKPVYDPLKVSLYGETNGRFVSLSAANGQPSPSIETLYTEASAPGLTNQPGTFEVGEGIRMTPVVAGDYIRLNYGATYQQYIAPNSGFSFQRLTFDLGHQFALYSTTRVMSPRRGNGPDDCAPDPSEKHARCPIDSVRNLEGSIGIRVLNVLSMTPGGNTVPFYFQPTLGGSDINGNPALSVFQDYRFRAPNILLVRENFEHSIGKWPIGVTVMADQGKLGLTQDELGSSHWLHSYAAGLTLRAGGFPEVFLLFAFGANQGSRTIANINTSLLGGSQRPSLF